MLSTVAATCMKLITHILSGSCTEIKTEGQDICFIFYLCIMLCRSYAWLVTWFSNLEDHFSYTRNIARGARKTICLCEKNGILTFKNSTYSNPLMVKGSMVLCKGQYGGWGGLIIL